MNKIILFLCFSLAACASQKQAKYKEDKGPKFSTSRNFVDKPEQLRAAAKQVLEELTAQSNPTASGAVREDNNEISTGWVYGISKDKYVLYDFNGSPRRKELAVRRKYSYNISPSLSGSQVVMKIEEEIQKVDLKNGEPLGWSSVTPDQSAYDVLVKKIQERVRSI